MNTDTRSYASDIIHSTSLGTFVWEFFIVSACTVVTIWEYTYIQTVGHYTLWQLDQLIILSFTTLLGLALWWNVLCICLLRICTAHVLPRLVSRTLLRFLQRWGNAHVRRIASHYLLRGTAAATLASSVALCGAHAAPLSEPTRPLLPAPDITQATLNIPQAPLLPTPLMPPSTPETGSTASFTPSRLNEITVQPRSTSHLPQPHLEDTQHTTGSLLPQPQIHEETHRSQNLVVREGDCLWTIAHKTLGNTASDANIARYVNQIYQANEDVIGQDPHLINPGITLILPHVGDLNPNT